MLFNTSQREAANTHRALVSSKDVCKQRLREYTNTKVCLEEDEFEVLANLLSVRDIRANDYLEQPGADKSTIFFMLSGLVRYFYLSDDGKEWNKAFVSANVMSTSFSKDFLGQSSPYGIQALEDTTVLIADYAAFEAMFEQYRGIERLGRKVLEDILIFKMNRERSFLQDKAEARYDDFITQYPLLLGRIPQYHIASYLGITEASLSRILRNRI